MSDATRTRLEPTRTSSDLTATEHMRRMLDECGVEWHDTKIGKGFITVFEHDGITWIATEHSSGRLSVKGCVKPTQGHYDGMTPAQAIAATLGSRNCSDNCTNSERTGTCHADETDTWECVCDGIGRYGKRVTVHVMECSECGRTYEHVNGGYEFCPRCRRKVVDE